MWIPVTIVDLFVVVIHSLLVILSHYDIVDAICLNIRSLFRKEAHLLESTLIYVQFNVIADDTSNS